ncbi:MULTISPECIES: dethiobiotin synthase [Flavobacterium]|uniref:dethiobiotin synthase n=1 Tax=Flavobacterium TaxID=237 RepID=UPI001FCB05F1|nr:MULTISPECIES: dethiobiotin synthase [Flavobacterium]UOK42969.1 dethiobiotin synthase [Flavobacterium enshiense]
MKLFITGIGTDVGKTIASAIITEALEADYWKPVQAGDLAHSDSHKVEKYISNKKTKFHPNAYALNTPASPHLAAELEGITIDIKNIKEPNPESYRNNSHLVIEGAGGVFVPLNDADCVIDLIQPDHKVVVVSRHYLGSINHTLLTVEALKSRKLDIVGIVFNGDDPDSYRDKASEDIILKKTGLKMIGRIENEPYFDQNVIQYYADKFRESLLELS